MNNNFFSLFVLETTTEVNQDEPQFALSVNAESFVPKVDKIQIVATACFQNKCLLSTALILVKDKYLEWQTFRALLDSGSETCLISNECANKLQHKTEKINTLISCLNHASMVVNGCVKVAISNQNKSFERELDMLVVKKITDFIPQKTLEINSDFSNFVELADSNFNVPGKIDLLLGENIFYELLKPERIKIKDSQLLLVNSVFGYIVTGNLDSINETKVHCGLIRDEDLNKTLEKFWKVEEVEEPIVKNKERLICEEHYTNTHFRTKEEVIEIHGFADASKWGYGAAVYCKSKNLKSETLVRLITSKSRVAPIKSLTIPRLELCAAVLLAKLVKRVVAALQLETAELYLWSDSMIVLAWLRKEPMDLKTFVQNRVTKIQELYPNQLWRHVPSDQNPADLVSRGVDPDKLLQQNLWFNGPTFLSRDDYPNRTINCREKLDEYNSELKNCVNEQIENFQSVLNIHVNDFLNDLLNLSNNYVTILRVLSFIFRFMENLKGINRVAGPLTTKEFEKAVTFLIKKVQEQEFSSDINLLKSKGSVPPNSKLKTLNPFLDDNDVLRVGG
ncbi:uncharacterized protein TNCV_3034661 [Trichonephila clavipes]|nr:uncharacterized protein TNCV_3034661 [Trichonephila clavipes]